MAPFPFFRLPRELRDRIYADVGSDYKQYCLECPIHMPPGEDNDGGKDSDDSDDSDDGDRTFFAIAVTSKPTKNLLLVSRAFKEEYEMEVRRDMVLSVKMDQDDERMGAFSRPLAECAGARRNFRMTTRLEVKNSEHCYGSPWLHDYEQLIRTFVLLMDNLKSIDYRFRFQFIGDQRRRGDANPDALKAIIDRKGLLWSSTPPSVPITNHILLNSPLFCVSESFQPTAVEHDRYPFFYEYAEDYMIAHAIETQPCNQVTFRATPSADEGQFWGLDLTVDQPMPSIDSEDVVHGAEMEYKAMLFEGEQKDYDDGYV